MPRPTADGMRASDIDIARENLAGGLLDLQASGDLGPETTSGGGRSARGTATGPCGTSSRAPRTLLDDRHLIDRRIRRLNDLGFDVDELLVEHDPEAYRLRVRPVLVRRDITPGSYGE